MSRVLLGFLLGLDELGEHPRCRQRRLQDATLQPSEGRPLGGLRLVEGEGHAELPGFEIEALQPQNLVAVQQPGEVLGCGGQRFLQRLDQLLRNADGVAAGHQVQNVLAGIEGVGQVPQLLHRDVRRGNGDPLSSVRAVSGGLLVLFGIGGVGLLGGVLLVGLGGGLLSGRVRVLGVRRRRVLGDVAVAQQEGHQRGEIVADDVAVAVDREVANLVGVGGRPQVAGLGVQLLGDGLDQRLAVSGVRQNRHGAFLLRVRGLEFAVHAARASG